MARRRPPLSRTPPPGPPIPRRPPPGAQRHTWLLFLLVILANFLLIRFLAPGVKPSRVPYTLFKEQVEKRNVQKITSRGENILGRFVKPVVLPATPGPLLGAPPRRVTDFSTTIPQFAGPGLESLLVANGVEISAEPVDQGSPWLGLLFSIAPALLLIGIYVWFFRRMSRQGGLGGGLMGIGRSRARRFDRAADGKVTFEDVAGIDEAENELHEIVDFLRDPKKYTRL